MTEGVNFNPVPTPPPLPPGQDCPPNPGVANTNDSFFVAPSAPPGTGVDINTNDVMDVLQQETENFYFDARLTEGMKELRQFAEGELAEGLLHLPQTETPEADDAREFPRMPGTIPPEADDNTGNTEYPKECPPNPPGFGDVGNQTDIPTQSAPTPVPPPLGNNIRNAEHPTECPPNLPTPDSELPTGSDRSGTLDAGDDEIPVDFRQGPMPTTEAPDLRPPRPPRP